MNKQRQDGEAIFQVAREIKDPAKRTGYVMNDRQFDEERVFHVARAIADDQPKNEYLDQICSGD